MPPTALPAVEREQVRALERQGQLLTGEHLGGLRAVGGKRVAVARATDRVEQPGSLRGQVRAVLATLRATGEQPVIELEKRFSNARYAVKRLAALGLVELAQRAVERPPLLSDTPERDQPPELNPAQLEAVKAEMRRRTVDANTKAPAQSQDALPFLRAGQACRWSRQVSVLALQALHLFQLFVPLTLKATGNQPVLGVDVVEATTGQVGLVLRALDAQLPLLVDLDSALLDLLQGSQRHCQLRWLHRFQQGACHRGVDPIAADGLAQPTNQFPMLSNAVVRRDRTAFLVTGVHAFSTVTTQGDAL